jgi:uncharacterized protein DUF4326
MYCKYPPQRIPHNLCTGVGAYVGVGAVHADFLDLVSEELPRPFAIEKNEVGVRSVFLRRVRRLTMQQNCDIECKAMSTHSTEQAAKAAGVSRITLARWLGRGLIRPTIAIPMKGQTLWRWTAADISRVKKLVGTFKPGPKPKVTKVVHCKRMPFDVFIGRPSKWGNPFKVPRDGATARVVIAKYRKWLMEPEQAKLRARIPELKGKSLGCYCRPKYECHGDVLKELADKRANKRR